MAVPSSGCLRHRGGNLLRLRRAPASGGEYSVVEGLEIDDFCRERIDASVAELREERDSVSELGLL